MNKLNYLVLPLIVLTVALTGCSTTKSGRLTVTTSPPPVADVSIVSAPVKTARESTIKATTSTERAVQIVERIVVAPGQEVQLKELKLELTTTIGQLKIASDQLDGAINKAVKLEGQVDDIRNWGVGQNALYVESYNNLQSEIIRADKADRKAIVNGRERDVFIVILSLCGALIAIVLSKPMIAGISTFPTWGPILAGLAIAGAAVAGYLATYLGVRLLVSAIVKLTM